MSTTVTTPAPADDSALHEMIRHLRKGDKRLLLIELEIEKAKSIKEWSLEEMEALGVPGDRPRIFADCELDEIGAKQNPEKLEHEIREEPDGTWILMMRRTVEDQEKVKHHQDRCEQRRALNAAKDLLFQEAAGSIIQQRDEQQKQIDRLSQQILATKPTTLAGVVAKLALYPYLNDQRFYGRRRDMEFHARYFLSTLDDLKNLAKTA